MKSYSTVLVGLLSAAAGAHAALTSPGDIAFTGFNADGTDNLAFVLLVSASPSQKIWFSDNEWNGSTFNTGESYYSWTAPAGGVPAGTVITLNNISSGVPSSLIGTGAGETGPGVADPGVSNADEAIYAYLASNAVTPLTFLALIANEDATVPYSLINTGLSEAAGTAIIFTGDEDGMRYTGPRNTQVSFTGYLTLLADKAANWETTTTDGTVFVPMNTTVFSTVPEPGTFPLAFMPVAAMLMRRRRD